MPLRTRWQHSRISHGFGPTRCDTASPAGRSFVLIPKDGLRLPGPFVLLQLVPRLNPATLPSGQVTGKYVDTMIPTNRLSSGIADSLLQRQCPNDGGEGAAAKRL